jgi:hypothetical protein
VTSDSGNIREEFWSSFDDDELLEWRELEVDGLDECLEQNSIDETISFYNEEYLEFIDSVPRIASIFLEMSIRLQLRKIYNSHCNVHF